MIIIVGASRGIGLGIAEHFSSMGEEVIGVSRSSPSNLSVFSEFFSADVTNKQQLVDVARNIRAKYDSIKCLINTAGVASMNLALMADEKSVQKQIQTNLVGTIYSCQAFAPLIMRSNEGRIINFSTIAAQVDLAGEAIYAASKSVVEKFTSILARELSRFNVTCNTIAPGPIRTDLLEGVSEAQILRIIEMQIIQKSFSITEIANLIESIISPNLACITGQVFKIGGAI